MKISWNWLNEHLAIPVARQEMARSLTAAGMHVETEERAGSDFVWDIEVTSNRPDAMNHFGMAREAGVILDAGIKLPPRPLAETVVLASGSASVAVAPEDGDLCSAYVARIIRGVRVGPSPEWVAERLRAVGVRPVNNIVDATNYALYELGHPLHAFDLGRLAGAQIRVRRALPGETLATLDGQTRRLEAEMLVIADRDRAVALAGVMGGAGSEISPHTTDVLLESAVFAPASVRRTARLLGLHTDASHRFERGCDPGIPALAADRCAALISEIAGGEILAGRLVAGNGPAMPPSRRVELRWKRLARLVGADIPAVRVRQILMRLGFEISENDAGLALGVPSWRADIELEEDVIEEVLRFYGFDAVPASLPAWPHEAPRHRPDLALERRCRDFLAARGLSEIMSYAFIATAANETVAAEPPDQRLRVANPLAESGREMRTSLLPGLAECLSYNQRRGNADLAMFEVGRSYFRGADGTVTERRGVAWGLTGRAAWGWETPDRDADYYDAKGVAEALGRELDLPELEFAVADRPWFEAGQQAQISAGGVAIGHVGILSGATREVFRLSAGVAFGEIDLSALPATQTQRVYTPVPRFPGVSVDVTLVHGGETPSSQLAGFMRQRGGSDLRGVRLKYRYEGEREAGRIRSTFELFYQRLDRSLTQEEVNTMHGGLIADLVRELAVEQG